ncbi:MAG TPA: hypothetical protein VFN88_14125 [Caulobacteraceae bacterium]|nr:hypothetical protein [Caulobacteraceae bacterium]
MVHIISVQAAEGGWSVTSSGADNEMMFLSGAKAEFAARRLGENLAADGQTAEIRIFLRDGAQAGRFICAPRPDLAIAG